MLRNHFYIALRNLWKLKVHSAIQVGGMAVGLLATLLIVQYVRFEVGYDRQSPHADRIWRVFNETHSNGRVVTKDANSHSIVGPRLRAERPEVVDFARLVNLGLDEATLTRPAAEPVLAGRFFAADPSFLRLFPQRFLGGDPRTCLLAPYQMVLTERVARQVFGQQNPVGQTVAIGDIRWAGQYTVTGVVADPPADTHLKFGVLVSYQTRYAKNHRDDWDSYWDYTYLLLAPGARPDAVQKRLAQLSDTHLKAEGIRLNLQPLTAIHLHSDLTYELEPNGRAQTVAILALTALAILVIAWLNSINLHAARALQRANEVGTRRLLGGTRGHLFLQFAVEAALVNGLAAVLAVACLVPALGFFASLVSKPLDAVSLGVGEGLGVAGVYALTVGLTAWVQASLFAGFRPIDLVQRRYAGLVSGKVLQKGLVVFQFSCSVALLIGLLVVHGQLRFLRHHSLGLQLDQMVTLKLPDFAWRDTLRAAQVARLEHRVSQLAGVAAACRSSAVPSLGINHIAGTSAGISAVGQPPSTGGATVYFLRTDSAFFRTFSIPFLAGNVFLHPNVDEQHRHVALNQSAARLLGFRNAGEAVGRQFFFNDQPGTPVTIHGVVADFHIETLKNPTRPTIYYCGDRINDAYLSVKIRPETLPQTLAAVQALWRTQFPDIVFRYTFLDQHFAAQYRAEQQFETVFGLFAGLAALVACLGLFGLATFTAEQRTKEIGVRKVLGASVASIVALLSKEFLKLVLVAVVIASPVAWYAMHRWLQGFAYRIDIAWWVFVVAGALTVGIALLTVGFQSVKAALTNPVKSLRNE